MSSDTGTSAEEDAGMVPALSVQTRSNFLTVAADVGILAIAPKQQLREQVRTVPQLSRRFREVSALIECECLFGVLMLRNCRGDEGLAARP